MNKNDRSSYFSQDPRLAHMEPERLSQLLSFAKELSDAPQNQKLNTLLSINQKASEKNLSFTAEERALLIHVLTEQLTPEEKKRAEVIRTIASRFSANENG